MIARRLALGLLAAAAAFAAALSAAPPLAPPALRVSAALAADCVPLSDFSKDAVGSFPRGWRAQKDEAKTVYRVVEEEGTRFLRATARGTAAHAAIEREWDLKEYPVVAWRWRPRTFPEGSDERNGRTNDSALGVYVAFPRAAVAVRSLKYVWSRVAPVGTRARASAGYTKMLVLRSGPAQKDWVEERVRVPEDYQKLFDAEPGKPRGIGVLTDADDTKSTAEGDYADFRLCRS
jgi:hypothetical protein